MWYRKKQMWYRKEEMLVMSDSTLEEHVFTPLQEGIRPNISKGRVLSQIGQTIVFDARRNFKKFIAMILINTIFIVLFLTINLLQDQPPTEATDYVVLSYLGFISFLILITAILFGGSIIVEDFEKQTGNILFPKIERGRLLVGRYVARFALASISLGVFYAEAALLTYINYDTIPGVMWESLGWAILYLHLVLSFVVLMSALLNRIATAQVASLFFLLMVFNIVSSILIYTGSTIEPLFILTYYGNIITAWFNMPPDKRYSDSNPLGGMGLGGDDRVFRFWSTPSAEGAIYGVIIYSAILLVIAYLIYRVKQSKT